MKQSLIAILAASALLALTGCGTTEPLVKYRNLTSMPQDSWLQDCDIVRPPTVEQYLKADRDERESLLTRNNVAQYKSIAQCNKDKAALRKWKAEQQQLIQKFEAQNQ